MTWGNSFATWDLLGDLGFWEDHRPSSNSRPYMTFDFENLRLSASLVWNERLAEVVFFTGVIYGQNSLGEVSFEMPRRVESCEQCAAWIAWNLDEMAPTRVFTPLKNPAWLLLGMQHQQALPWVRRLAAYQARQQCSVERSWLRQGLNALGKAITKADPESIISFGFDGSILIFSVGSMVIPLPGAGDAWQQRFVIPIAELSRLPKRLMQETIGISVWDGTLHIGRNIFSGVSAMKTTNTDCAPFTNDLR